MRRLFLTVGLGFALIGANAQTASPELVSSAGEVFTIQHYPTWNWAAIGGNGGSQELQLRAGEIHRQFNPRGFPSKTPIVFSTPC